MDLTRISPAPWFADESYLVLGNNKYGEEIAKFDGPVKSKGFRNDNCAFVALARKAFDILMRRGWHVIRHHDGRWHAATDDVIHELIVPIIPKLPLTTFLDPFTALVEADKWYAENVEN